MNGKKHTARRNHRTTHCKAIEETNAIFAWEKRFFQSASEPSLSEPTQNEEISKRGAFFYQTKNVLSHWARRIVALVASALSSSAVTFATKGATLACFEGNKNIWVQLQGEITPSFGPERPQQKKDSITSILSIFWNLQKVHGLFWKCTEYYQLVLSLVSGRNEESLQSCL